MHKKKGFTLVELLIAIAMAGYIFGILGQVIYFSLENYNVNIEVAEAMKKIQPVLKRIEADLTESKDPGSGESPVKPELLDINGDGTAIQVKTGDENTYWYWWDSDGDGNLEIDGTATETKHIYRTSSSGIAASINDSLSDTKKLLRSQSDEWEGFIKVEDFSFELFNTDANYKTTTTTSAMNADYIRIKVELTGTKSKNPPTLKFSTGFELPE